MNCKNCEKLLEQDANYCNNCGSKVITERITFKALIVEVFINVFGFDSRFFLTLRMIAKKPHVVISEVLSGVRKRYMNPFAFLAVGAAISLLTFNYFEDDFKKINAEINSSQIQAYQEKANMDIAAMEGLTEKEIQKLQIEKKGAQMQLRFLDWMMDFMLRYYNLLSFLFIVFYAILSKWTFWKPHNFGEHIVINSYLFGFTLYLSLILFFLALVVHPSIYMYSIFIYIAFYMFAFGKLYKLSFWKNILKLLRFILGLAILIGILIVIGLIVGIVISYFGLVKI